MERPGNRKFCSGNNGAEEQLQLEVVELVHLLLARTLCNGELQGRMLNRRLKSLQAESFEGLGKGVVCSRLRLEAVAAPK